MRLHSVRAVLCDIDGTLMWRGQPLPGAAHTITDLRRRGLALRFLTNITARTPADIAAELGGHGIAVHANEVMTATTACVHYLAQRPALRCHFIVPAEVKPAFCDCIEDDHCPQAVVLGDVSEGFDYPTLNRAFNMLRNGAELIAMQRNLFWFDTAGAKLDCGAFVAALEAAAGVRATVTGKPSLSFFQQALDQLSLAAADVLVVGDDPGTDLQGAAAIGALGLLVQTGKSLPKQGHKPNGNPEAIENIGQLPRWIDELCGQALPSHAA